MFLSGCIVVVHFLKGVIGSEAMDGRGSEDIFYLFRGSSITFKK